MTKVDPLRERSQNTCGRGEIVDVLGYVLVVIGAVGCVLRSVEFVQVTIPRNYGSNPGFGAYESMVLPWFAVSAIGLAALHGSWRWALVPLLVAPFALGIISMVLGRLFGR